MAYGKIASLTNPRVKHVVRLRNGKQRKKDGLTIVEGLRETQRAFEAQVMFKELFFCPALWEERDAAALLIGKLERTKGIAVYETTQTVFSKIAYGDRLDGILAVFAPVARPMQLGRMNKPVLVVIIESVEKPGNLGAIIRTCDSAGVDAVIICDEQTDIYNPNVIRASIGTVFGVNVWAASNDAALNLLKSHRIKICAAMPQAKTNYTQADLTDALAIVVGSEQKGLSAFWQKHADMQVKIPMRGRGDSLNVSVSAAILLYEAIRQRSQ